MSFLRPLSPLRLKAFARLFAHQRADNREWQAHLAQRAQQFQELAQRGVHEPVTARDITKSTILDLQGLTMQQVRNLETGHVEIAVQETRTNERAIQQRQHRMRIADTPTLIMQAVPTRDTSGKIEATMPRERNEYARPAGEEIRNSFAHAITAHQLRYGKTPSTIWCSQWIYNIAPFIGGCKEIAERLRVGSAMFDHQLETES